MNSEGCRWWWWRGKLWSWWLLLVSRTKRDLHSLPFGPKIQSFWFGWRYRFVRSWAPLSSQPPAMTDDLGAQEGTTRVHHLPTGHLIVERTEGRCLLAVRQGLLVSERVRIRVCKAAWWSSGHGDVWWIVHHLVLRCWVVRHTGLPYVVLCLAARRQRGDGFSRRFSWRLK